MKVSFTSDLVFNRANRSEVTIVPTGARLSRLKVPAIHATSGGPQEEAPPVTPNEHEITSEYGPVPECRKIWQHICTNMKIYQS